MKVLAHYSLDKKLKYFAECFIRNEIPAKFPYELRENAKFYDRYQDSNILQNAAISDVIRIFEHKKDMHLQPDEKGV